MTNTLPMRVRALRERLTRLDKLSSNVDEASALEGLRGDLAGRTTKLDAQLKNQALLAEAAIAVPPPATLLAARKRASVLLEKFRVQTKASTLKRGQAWRSLLEEIDAGSRDLALAVRESWHNYRQQVFAGDAPAVIRPRLARTRANDATFVEYQRLFNRLKTAFDMLPSDQTTIENVKQVAAELESTAQGFDFAVPAEVKGFLEAVLSVNGAPLELLTPAVLKWLKENDSFDSYRISSTGRG